MTHPAQYRSAEVCLLNPGPTSRHSHCQMPLVNTRTDSVTASILRMDPVFAAVLQDWQAPDGFPWCPPAELHTRHDIWGWRRHRIKRCKLVGPLYEAAAPTNSWQTILQDSAPQPALVFAGTAAYTTANLPCTFAGVYA